MVRTRRNPAWYRAGITRNHTFATVKRAQTSIFWSVLFGTSADISRIEGKSVLRMVARKSSEKSDNSELFLFRDDSDDSDRKDHFDARRAGLRARFREGFFFDQQ